MNIHFVFFKVKDDGDKGQFGIIVQNENLSERYYLMYKGEPLELSEDDILGVRFVGKRELGEVLRESANSDMIPLWDTQFRKTLSQRNQM